MKISTKGRYALRLMIDLAINGTESYVPIKSVSQRQEISEKYLEQIITQLSRAKLVKSARGAQAGTNWSVIPKTIQPERSSGRWKVPGPGGLPGTRPCHLRPGRPLRDPGPVERNPGRHRQHRGQHHPGRPGEKAGKEGDVKRGVAAWAAVPQSGVERLRTGPGLMARSF